MTARKRSDWYSDTDPKALEVFLGLQRAISAAKLDLTLELSEIVMRLSETGVRSQYPDADDREVFLRTAARRLDRDTMIPVYGWDPNR